MTDRQNRKKRYNIVHLLRKRGIGVDTINHAIQINCGLHEQLDLTGMRYVRVLREEYGFVMQTCIEIPLATLRPALKFHRKKPINTPDMGYAQ